MVDFYIIEMFLANDKTPKMCVTVQFFDQRESIWYKEVGAEVSRSHDGIIILFLFHFRAVSLICIQRLRKQRFCVYSFFNITILNFPPYNILWTDQRQQTMDFTLDFFTQTERVWCQEVGAEVWTWWYTNFLLFLYILGVILRILGQNPEISIFSGSQN